MLKDQKIIQIKLMFDGLNKKGASADWPKLGALSEMLSPLVEFKTKNEYFKAINQSAFSYFATAAVEMWHRSIHSLLISASLTKSSPLWSSVSGYYSSHYAVRAFAHLLGYYQLFNKKCIVQLELDGSKYYYHFLKKNGNDREHKYYWKIVKQYNSFINDPFFTNNEEIQLNSKNDKSDISHRSKANYSDHLDNFPKFQVLDEAYLKQRINKISNITLSDAPIPRVGSYPDIESVQLIAYHRMIRFRLFLDQLLSDSNRFWSVHRRPTWCPIFMDFQAAQPEFASIYKELA